MQDHSKLVVYVEKNMMSSTFENPQVHLLRQGGYNSLVFSMLLIPPLTVPLHWTVNCSKGTVGLKKYEFHDKVCSFILTGMITQNVALKQSRLCNCYADILYVILKLR